MKTSFVYAMAGTKIKLIELSHLTPVGGSRSSGLMLEGLKHSGDYAVIAASGDDLTIHVLRGKQHGTRSLPVGEVCEIEDLSLIRIAAVAALNPDNCDGMGSLKRVLNLVQESAETLQPLSQLLAEVMRISGHEMGLVVTRKSDGDYEIVSNQNVLSPENLLSDTLVQDVLKSQQPAFLQNVIGSAYQASESIIAAGLLSIFCWPQIFKNEIVGVLITGSRRPHPGLRSAQRAPIETLVQLGALLTKFSLRELALRRELAALREHRRRGPFNTQSAKLNSVIELAAQVVNSDLAVLIQGETGVGKEILSQWMHDQDAKRSRGPFVPVNCGAIPSELLESLLFGHRKGAFTGAHSDQVGKIQQANGGTLFLDEVGDLPLALQAKLLRVLNDKIVEPLGSARGVSVDVRLISATHKPLREMTSRAEFREDLYYRIAEMTLLIPALRERPGDILLIAADLLKEISGQKTFSYEARTWLISQPWRGNVRELKSVVKRAAVLCTGNEIEVRHLQCGPPENEISVSSSDNWLGATNLESAKLKFIMQKIHYALQLTQGNRTQAANLLGVTPRTLFRYLEQEKPTELS